MKPSEIRVLITCEESQVVCTAFRKRGFEAYSCDLLPTRGEHPEWHYQMDMRNLSKMDWNLLVSFPPCTDIAVSGARWFPEKIVDGRQQKAIALFKQCFDGYAEHVAVENPVGVMSTVFRKPDQIIQPWMFGHGETKATCLWLQNLPKLVPTNIVSGREARIHKMAPGLNRSRDRAVTYQGIANAMATQWGDYLCQTL